MFRLKIALAFVLLVSVLVGTTYITIQKQLGSTLESDAALSLQRASLVTEQSSRLDEFSLLEKARFVAARQELHHAMTAEYQGELAEYERHMQVHRWLERDQIAFTELKPAQNRNLDRNLMQREPHAPELFTAVDASGRGVATLGKDLLSWFGDNVAKTHPIILDVMNKGEARTDVWLWSYNPTDAKQLYVVAIAPIRASQNSPVLGVIILGNAINNGVALNKQAQLSNTEKLSKPARATDLSPEIAIFHDSKIYGSTFNPTMQRALSDALLTDASKISDASANSSISIELDGKPYNALVRYFANNSNSETPAGLILLSNSDAIQSPVGKALSTILSAAAAVLLIGIILFFFFIFQFTRPITKIENGINEIITGNKDYEFVAHPGNEYTASLSHALNLLSRFLQGKSLDDDAPKGGWDELMPEAVTSVEDRKGAAPTVQGISLTPKAKETETSTPTEEDVS